MGRKTKTAKFLHRNLDAIIETCENSAKQWDKQSVPLPLLQKCCSMAKIHEDSLPVGSERLKLAEAFNKTIDTMYNGCMQKAAEYETNNVSVELIKSSVETIKSRIN